MEAAKKLQRLLQSDFDVGEATANYMLDHSYQHLKVILS